MKLKKQLIIAEVNGEYVAVPEIEENGSRMIIRLNSTGATILNGLQQNLTEQQIVGKLMQEYDVDQVRAQKSVSKILELLKENNLIEEE